MLSGSERERGRGEEREKEGSAERKTEMRNEREKGYLWICQPSGQKGDGVGAAVVFEGEGKWALM